MKKTLLALLLTGALLLSFASCAIGDTTGGDTSTPISNNNSQNNTPTPSDPAALIGSWHHKANATVYQFSKDGTVKVFYLQPGYFTYREIEEGTYTYDGTNLTCALKDGTTIRSNNCSATAEKVTLIYSGKTWELSPVTELPTEHPTFEFPDFASLSASATLPSGNFTGLTVNAEKTYESAVSQVLKSFSAGQFTLLKEGTAQKNDIVNIDYKGLLNGVAFAGGTAKQQTVAVGDGFGMIDGFGSQIAGHAVGETFQVNVTFPSNYHASDLAGKPVVFEMTLNGIYDTEEAVSKVYEERLTEDIYTLIEGLSGTEVSEEANRYHLQSLMDYYHYYAFYYNYEYEDFLAANGMTVQTVLDQSKELSRAYLLAYLLAQKYEIAPSEEFRKEIYDQYYKDLTENSGYSKEEAEEYLANEGKNMLEADIYLQFTAEYLIQNNTLTPALNPQ